MVRRFAIAFCVFLCTINYTFGQKFGFFLNSGLIRLEGDFRQFKTIQDSIPLIGSGSSISFGIGTFLQVPLIRNIYLNNNFSIRYFSTNIEANRNLSARFDSNLVSNKFILEMSGNLNYKSFQVSYFPSLQFQIAKNFFANAGISIGYEFFTPKNLIYYEKSYIKGLDFVSSTQEFTEGKHQFPIIFTFDIGANYTIPLNFFGLFRFGIAPYFSFGFVNVAKDFVADVTNLGVNFYIYPERIRQKRQPIEQIPLPPVEDLLPKPPLVIYQDTTPISKPLETITVDFVGIFREDGKERFVPAEVSIIDQMYNANVPLLNYIFFDYATSEIPRRYNKIHSPTEFNIKSLVAKDILDVHYDILNIIGYRLRQKPNSTITLVGCNSKIGEELDNIELSRKRATEIANYLASVWEIEPRRIQIEARGLPAHPSNPNVPEGSAENQRVEIYSDDPEILSHITLVDTAYSFQPHSLRFYTKWNFTTKPILLNIIIRSPLDTTKSMSLMSKTIYPPIDSFDIELQSVFLKDFLNFPLIEFELNFDFAENQNSNQKKIIPIMVKRQISIEKPRKNKILLPPFDFNSSVLKQQQIDFIQIFKPTISSAKEITLVGYSDVIGSSDYNFSLAKARVDAVEMYLKNAIFLPSKIVSSSNSQSNTSIIINKKAIGEFDQIFDNKLPEGRFFSRTVEIFIDN